MFLIERAVEDSSSGHSLAGLEVDADGQWIKEEEGQEFQEYKKHRHRKKKETATTEVSMHLRSRSKSVSDTPHTINIA